LIWFGNKLKLTK